MSPKPPAVAESSAGPSSVTTDNSHHSPTSPRPVDDHPSSPVQEGEDAATADKEEQGSDPWQAVFSAEANAWYFWNAQTGETTWSNPRERVEASPDMSQEVPLGIGLLPATADDRPDALPGIDPELAWLDPSGTARADKSSLAQSARFNSRTGRFHADPVMNPDRISDFQRGHRQQEAYYDVTGWEASLAGRGLKRGSEAETDQARKRPSSKQIESFRKAKEDKKRKKLTSWLGS
ncbi:hypothetical protein JCM11641_004647 [Rhodosporidiobolus odoratus]